MKRFFFLAAVLLVLGAGSIFAQNRGGGRPNGGGQAPTGGMSGGQRAEGIPSQRPNDSTGNRRQRSEGTSQGSSGNGENRGQRPEGIRNGDLKRLGLSDEQKAQIKQIRNDARENQTDPAAVRSQIEGVLTAEQLEKLKQRTNQPKP